MHKWLVTLAVLSAVSGPAAAQSAPQAQAPADTAAKPQTLKKVVCRHVEDEEATGSHIATTHKVCRTIEVPAGGSASSDRAPAPTGPERGSH